VAKAEGLKLKFNETSWDSMFAGLDAGRFDVIANQVGINQVSLNLSFNPSALATALITSIS
jgi:ABC-type amino acid transport substrate-binding protein